MQFMSPPSTPRASLSKKFSASTTPMLKGAKCNSDSHQKVSMTFDEESVTDSNPKECISSSKSNSTPGMDRFIPNRKTIDFDACSADLYSSMENNDFGNDIKHSKRLCRDLLEPKKKRMMNVFQDNTDFVHACASDPMLRSYQKSHLDDSCTPKKQTTSRIIPAGPYRVLDAPDLMDDYYLNLLHWGKSNILAVALQQSVYLWHADSGHIDQLFTLADREEYVTSVQWSEKDNTIAVGTSGNIVQLWDASRLTKIRDCVGHSARVSSLSWNDNMISSGGRDSVILHHDIRQNRRLPFTYVGHQQEVCGLAWSPDGKTLASGGNENLLCLWDAAMSGQSTTERRATPGLSSSHTNIAPRAIMRDHQAAVKALSWCPWQRNTLASGGGTADRTLRIWNASTDTAIKSVDTGSQVCSIQWSDAHKELVSSHGFSDNQLILWKYSNMTKIREFHGHSSRVLHLAKSPDGNTICSASSDETLRFWDIFGGGSAAAKSPRKSGGGRKSIGSMNPSGGSLLGLNSPASIRSGMTGAIR